MPTRFKRVAVAIVAAAVLTVSVSACDSSSLSGERKSLAKVVQAVPRPDGIVLTACNDVDAFTIPNGAVSLLASCFATPADGASGDVRGFVDDLVTAVGARADQAWSCEAVGVGLIFCSAVVTTSGGAPNGVRFIVQLRADVLPATLPQSFHGEVDIAVGVAPKQ
jgi:hypothetical protein